MSPQIVITIAPDGTSRVETQNMQGTSCRTASRFIEQALGRQVSEQLKPEFYHQSEQHQLRQTGASS